MKIMVFDVPAEDGGALSILQDFYEQFLQDDKNNYIFVVGKPVLRSEKNVEVLRFPWIKKSWFHRLYFDYFVAAISSRASVAALNPPVSRSITTGRKPRKRKAIGLFGSVN